jgi:hypothetical protein
VVVLRDRTCGKNGGSAVLGGGGLRVEEAREGGTTQGGCSTGKN